MKRVLSLAFVGIVAVSSPLSAEDPKLQTAPADCDRGGPYDEFHKAIAACTEAIRINPQNAEAYSNRASAYLNCYEDDKAIADCTRAIRLAPKLAVAYFYRSAAYRNKLEYDKAIADSTEAIRLNPRLIEAYINRGLIRYLKNEHDKALADWTEAIRTGPEGWQVVLPPGQGLREEGRIRQGHCQLQRDCPTQPEI